MNIGGDDYIKKPYTLSVLLAKVKVILKRIGAGELAAASNNRIDIDNETGNVKKDNIILNPAKRTITANGNTVILKAKEYQLFAYLYEHPNRIIT